MPSYQYTPTTWVTGDTITATKLNNLELGIQQAHNSFKLYTCTDTNATLDCNYNDLKEALLYNCNIFLIKTDSNGTEYSILTGLEISSDIYYATFYDGQTYTAPSADTNLSASR